MSYPSPGEVAKRSNTSLDWCTSWNFNADLIDQSLVDAQIIDNGVLTITRTNGEIVDNPMPYFTSFVVDGIDFTLDIPPNGLDLSYTAGEYQIGADVFDVISATLTITSGDATNPRKDLVIADNLGVISILDGTPSATPVYPTQPSNTLILARLFVPANADATTGDILLTIESASQVETGNDGDTLRYDSNSNLYVANSSLKSDGSKFDFGSYGAYTELLNINGRLLINDTSAPGITTNKLYSVSGDLYWDGIQLNTSAAVGAGSTTNSTLRWNGSAWVEETSFLIESTGATEWSGVGSIRLDTMGNDGVDELYAIGTGTYAAENRMGMMWKQSSNKLELINESLISTSSNLTLGTSNLLIKTQILPDYTEYSQDYNQLIITSHDDGITENTFLFNPSYYRLGGQLEAASNRYFFIDSTNVDGASQSTFRIFGDNIGTAGNAGNPSIQSAVQTDSSYIDMGVAYGPKAGIHIKQTTATTPDISIGHNSTATIGNYSGIELMRNVGTNKTSKDQDCLAITIGARNTTVNDGVVNTVVLGGSGRTARSSNTVYFGGGQNINTRTVTATTTALASDYMIFVDTSVAAGSKTVNLPASPSAGRTYIIKDIGGQANTRNIVLDPDGATLIDGAATKTINTAYGAFYVTFNGTQWSVY